MKNEKYTEAKNSVRINFTHEKRTYMQYRFVNEKRNVSSSKQLDPNTI
jgi:hypothetical protein